jgi:hypothetical protein
MWSLFYCICSLEQLILVLLLGHHSIGAHRSPRKDKYPYNCKK